MRSPGVIAFASSAGHRHRHLERRARRVEAGRRLVDQRRRAGCWSIRSHCACDTPELNSAGIERRVGGHRHHLAVAAVQHHGAGAFVAEMRRAPPAAARRRWSGRHRRPACPPDAIQFADHAADGVDFELHRPGPAAQIELVEFLDPGAADADAGQRQHRIVGHIGLVRRRDVADDMRERLRRTDRRRVVPTSTRMPGRSGAFTSIRAISSQVRNRAQRPG